LPENLPEKPRSEPDNSADDIAEMNFEDALGTLEDIVRKLEGGQVSLEDSLEIYTRGTRLRQHCEAKLKDASARIEKITMTQDGIPGTVELDAG